jgi:serine/threonine protein kinase
MLDNLCNIKVADFGFMSTDAGSIAKHRTYMGTRCYMAPELPRVCKEKKQDYYDGRKVDVFAIGLTLMCLVDHQHFVVEPSLE